MNFFLIAVYLFIVVYTVRLAINLWKKESKPAGVIIALLAACYPVLLLWVILFR